MLRYLFKLIRAMHSDTDPRQISLGFSLGMILGLTPLYSPHNLIVFLAILFFRVNVGAAILSWGVFSVLAFLLDPAFNQIGMFILAGTGILTGLWTSLYNMTLFPYTRFNNTIVMGSLAFSILASYPVYWGGKLLVLKYRETFMDRFNKWKVIQVLKTSNMYKWYSRYNAMKG
ncbi:MAG: TIGR03546 family protein [Deltaproteobacteria bacterium]|nr:TIGR03546 family protein [Deltaproteobacteria bacterium]